MFEAGVEYKRTEIHRQYGGQAQGGMSTPARHPLIFLFTGTNGELYGYQDHFEDGIFLYTGEGQTGDMRLVRANKALSTHLKDRKRVFLFEQTRKGWVRLIGEVQCLGLHYEQRPDRDGEKLRQAIVFHLDVLTPHSGQAQTDNEGPLSETAEEPTGREPLNELRQLALRPAPRSASPKERARSVRIRSKAVTLYALKRSEGICESCLKPAPFLAKWGAFLEVHHVHRLCDGGPDHPAAVAAVCPNCHREIHYGREGQTKNRKLIEWLLVREGRVPEIDEAA